MEQNKKFKFIKMTPTQNLIDSSRISLDRITSLLPENARVVFRMSRHKGVYHCDIEVIYSGLRLRADIIDKLPMDALFKAEDEIVYKITGWRMHGLASVSGFAE